MRGSLLRTAAVTVGETELANGSSTANGSAVANGDTAQEPAVDDDTDYYHLRFKSLAKLYGAEGLQRLKNAHVAVIGLGGVGSWTVEALARSGVGKLTLVDLDTVCISNTNRQLHAISANVGHMKAEVMKQRVFDINPECEVQAELDFVTEDTVEALLLQPSANGDADRVGRFDCVIDAIDSVDDKCALLDLCRQVRMPVVTVGAAGGRVDPTRVTVADVTRADSDKLLFRVRKTLRQDYNFPRGTRRNLRGRKWGVACVYSTETVENEDEMMDQGGESCEIDFDNPRMGMGRCDSLFGTVTFVTGTFGFMAAGVAVNMLARGADHEGGAEWRWSPHALRGLRGHPAAQHPHAHSEADATAEGAESWESVLNEKW